MRKEEQNVTEKCHQTFTQWDQCFFELAFDFNPPNSVVFQK